MNYIEKKMTNQATTINWAKKKKKLVRALAHGQGNTSKRRCNTTHVEKKKSITTLSMFMTFQKISLLKVPTNSHNNNNNAKRNIIKLN